MRQGRRGEARDDKVLLRHGMTGETPRGLKPAAQVRMRCGIASCRTGSLGVAATLIAMLAGCATAGSVGTGGRASLRDSAMDCLEVACRYRTNPAVRLGAVEALEASGRAEALPWIRVALLDESRAVRFAACVSAGRLSDRSALSALRERVRDEDASVQVAALFALHRLGDTRLTGRMPGYLLDHEDIAVRRNAAMVLGLMGEPGAVKVLARAMKDRDEGVRQQTLEAMARLGNVEARRELALMTCSGVGSEEVFAIGALAGTREPQYLDTLRYKLESASHLETRLAAARGLGILGSDEGFAVARTALASRRASRRDPDDPPANQLLRTRLMALAALGTIGRTEALPLLEPWLKQEVDPRLRVAAARAVLEILADDAASALPSRASSHGGRRNG